jgi:predicted TIM-barrel fold metal-dependent hydrolase
MIIDADCHISPFTEGIQVDALLFRMDRAGVHKAITWLQPVYFRDVEQGNAYVNEAARLHPDRVIPFGWVDPHQGYAASMATIRRCIDEYGFPGVKLNGAQNEFFIDDERISIPLIEEITRAGKLLAFHIGTDAYENTHPYRLGKIAKRFPDTCILAVHMGGVASRDLTNAMIEIAAEYQNIILIGSSVKSKPILTAIKTLGAPRVCFGSDTPFEIMHVEVARYHALLDGEVDENEKELVMGKNVENLVK